MTTTDTTTAHDWRAENARNRATFSDALARLGLTVTTAPKPFREPTDPEQFRWSCRVERNGQHVLTTDYHTGIGHAKLDSIPPEFRPPLHGSRTAFEQEQYDAILSALRCSVWPECDPVDVLSCLAMEADVLQHSTFESWAGAFGYDPDSRKGEATYRACLEIALALRTAIGDGELATLHELASKL